MDGAPTFAGWKRSTQALQESSERIALAGRELGRVSPLQSGIGEHGVHTGVSAVMEKSPPPAEAGEPWRPHVRALAEILELAVAIAVRGIVASRAACFGECAASLALTERIDLGVGERGT